MQINLNSETSPQSVKAHDGAEQCKTSIYHERPQEPSEL